MQRRRWVTFFGLPFFLVSLGLLAAGCQHSSSGRPAPSASQAASQPAPPAVPGSSSSGADFQPYTLLPQPAPKPPVATHRNRVLHLTLRAGQPYLIDGEGHAYRCGRDTEGHLYPTYRDRDTGASYPLYYDSDRDRLYRIARADDGRYYRGYVGDPADRYYASDRDYDRFRSTEYDRPVIEDSYNRLYNPDSYANDRRDRYYHEYSLPAAAESHGGHNNSEWLWAIPVVVAAYFLLQPHHHSSTPTQYAYSPGHRPQTVITRPISPYRATIINSNTIINNRVVVNHTVINTVNQRRIVNNVNRAAVMNHPRPVSYAPHLPQVPAVHPPFRPFVPVSHAHSLVAARHIPAVAAFVAASAVHPHAGHPARRPLPVVPRRLQAAVRPANHVSPRPQGQASPHAALVARPHPARQYPRPFPVFRPRQPHMPSTAYRVSHPTPRRYMVPSHIVLEPHVAPHPPAPRPRSALTRPQIRASYSKPRQDAPVVHASPSRVQPPSVHHGPQPGAKPAGGMRTNNPKSSRQKTNVQER